MICMKKYILLCIIIISFFNISCFFKSQSIFEKNPQLLAEIKADLASHRWDIRLIGLRKLYDTNEFKQLPESEDLLLTASFDEHTLVRIEAINMLAELKTPAAANRILTIAKEDRNENVKWQAIIALGTLRERQAIPVLIEATKSNDWLIREAAYKSINRIATSADRDNLVHVIVNGILDPVTAVKCATLENIPFYHPEIYNAIRLTLLQRNIPQNLLVACFNAIAGYALDATVKEILVNHLVDRNPEIRIIALRTLRQDNTYPKKN